MGLCTDILCLLERSVIAVIQGTALYLRNGVSAVYQNKGKRT